MSSSKYRDTLHSTYSRDGITGHGEGAPIVRYHEDAAGAQKAADSVRDLLCLTGFNRAGELQRLLRDEVAEAVTHTRNRARVIGQHAKSKGDE